MVTNIIFFVLGVLFSGVAFMLLNRQKPVGELQVDSENEIVQVAFYSIQDLDTTIHQKQQITLNVIHKKIEFQIPQEKQGL